MTVRWRAAIGAGLLLAGPAMAAVDLQALWDFGQPARSEQRFREALRTAEGDDALILKAQIARTWSIRREYRQALLTLSEIEPALGRAGPEARTHYFLEVGRTFASATHRPEELTLHARAMAREAYSRALGLARSSGLDALAIDALHMFAFVDTDPQDGLRWADEALAIAVRSAQRDARRWEATLRRNRGVALNQLGRHDEALAEFRRALPLEEARGPAREVRIAHWLIAHTQRLRGRLDEARDVQLRLEREWEAAGEADPYVFEELEAIYRALGDAERAGQYAARLKAVRKS